VLAALTLAADGGQLLRCCMPCAPSMLQLLDDLHSWQNGWGSGCMISNQGGGASKRREEQVRGSRGHDPCEQGYGTMHLEGLVGWQ